MSRGISGTSRFDTFMMKLDTISIRPVTRTIKLEVTLCKEQYLLTWMVLCWTISGT